MSLSDASARGAVAQVAVLRCLLDAYFMSLREKLRSCACCTATITMIPEERKCRRVFAPSSPSIPLSSQDFVDNHGSELPDRPLDPAKREIRLLYPRVGLLDRTVHTWRNLATGVDPWGYTMRHISLQTDPPPIYNAISYCWGKERQTKPVRIDGDIYTAPLTALAALRGACRASGMYKTPLWIDAICINQADLAEKGR